MLHNKLSILCCMLSLVIVTICSTNTAQRSAQVTRVRGRVRNDYKKLPVAETFRSVIVHLDRWTFEDIKNECKNRLGQAGYAAVQVSPVTRHAKPVPEYPGLERISVVSYEIDSDSGTEEQLREMITECNRNNVRVLIDVVLNHMMKEIDDDGRNQKDKIKQRLYGPVNEPAMFFSKYFHNELYLREQHYKKGTFEFREGMLAGRHDLRQIVDGAINVHMFGLLYKLISMGAAGFRVLNADHMDPEDLVKLYDTLPDVTFEKTPTRPFIYSDVYDPIEANDWAIQDEDYVKYTRVTDYKFAYVMANVFLNRNKKLSRLQKFGLEKHDTRRGEARVTDGALRVSEDSVVFVNTPMTDLFKTRGVTQFPVMPYEFINPEKNFRDSKLAVGFMLTYGHGMPLISTPFNVQHRVPYHRKAEIEKVVTWRNYILNVNNGKFPAISEWDFKLFSNQGSFCVGDHGFVVFNGEKPEEALDRISKTCFKRPGVYCDILSGGPNRNNIAAGVKGGDLVCYGKYIVVGEDKKAHIKLDKDDSMQLYTSELVGQTMNIAQKSGNQEMSIAQKSGNQEIAKSGNQEMSIAQKFVDQALTGMAIGIFIGTSLAGHPGAAVGAVIGSWISIDGKERIKSWCGMK